MIKETHRHEATDGSKQIDRIDFAEETSRDYFYLQELCSHLYLNSVF